MTFSGGITFHGNGIQGNASNGYANTHFIPVNDFTSINTNGYGYYSLTPSNGGAKWWDMGVYDVNSPGGNSIYCLGQWSTTGMAYIKNNTYTQLSNVAVTDGEGLYHGTRLDSNTVQMWKDGTKIIDNGSIFTGHSSTQALQLVHAHNSSGEI